jgi:hypothetical protein
MRSRNRLSSSSPSTKPSWLPGGWYLHIAKTVQKANVTAPIHTDEAGKLFGLQGQDVRQRLMQPQA